MVDTVPASIGSNAMDGQHPIGWMRLLALVRKYKVLHVIFWVLSWRSLVHTLVQQSPEPSLQVIQHSTTITILFQMLMVYTIVYALLPHFFRRGQYGRFIGASLLTVVVCAIGAVFAKEVWMRAVIDPAYKVNHLIVALSNMVDSAVLAFIWTMIYMAEYFFLKDRRNAQLEQERLRTELDFLKAQLNPHFLFNTLNSLHVIMRHDMKQAEKTLMEFSALLRYQLYDCNGTTTTLVKEVEFLRNYIELERIRHGEQLDVVFEYPDVVPYQEVAPFVLIPFVENAFKHVSHFSRANRISIVLRCVDGQMDLRVENTFEPPDHGSDHRKGIGLENTRRRLELLYPQRHTLEVGSDKGIFCIHLMIRP